jgi:hypothetical protein
MTTPSTHDGWSPKLLKVVLPRRRRILRDPVLSAMRVPGCPGCEGFGICAAHDTRNGPVRRHGGARPKP